MYRSQMTGQERQARSALKPYITYREMLRATLLVRGRVCGKRCKCAEGKKHRCVVVFRSKGGRTEQLYVRRGDEEKARQWIKNYWEIWELLEKVSESYWERLKRKG